MAAKGWPKEIEPHRGKCWEDDDPSAYHWNKAERWTMYPVIIVLWPLVSVYVAWMKLVVG